MTKRLLVALLAGLLALLPLSAAAAEDEPAPEPSLGEIVSTAVADYLQGLDLDEESAQAVADAVAELVETIADVAAQAAEAEDGEAETAEEDDIEEAEEAEEEEVGDADDDGVHGEIVSTVAHCAPRGKLLKGTGLNHGTFVSAVASGETLVVPAVNEDGELDADAGEEFTVETVEDAEAACEALDAMAADLEEAQDGDGADPELSELADDSDEGDGDDTGASKREEAKARKAERGRKAA